MREASFQIIGAWFRQAQLSLRISQVVSETERKYFVDIPEQGQSWFYTSLGLSVSFVKEIASPSRGWREGGLSSYQRVI